eukprot:TRINITY_DN44398_c0_g1_i1.p2 TRINITY_DN44398_c0_g1~~TRINITY_DN44398_c0_g1_i1.p2  ORF type:complete len:237 (-),score=69.75 TRINITY_DN44398_c0_g1_i1:128-838(-)
MQLLAALPNAADTAEPFDKKRKHETGSAGSAGGVDLSHEDTKKLLELISKMVLNNTQQIRAMRSILLLCYSIPTQNKMVATVSSTMRQYDGLKQQYSTKEEKLAAIGPHHVQAWNAIVSNLEEVAKKENIKTLVKEEQVNPVEHYVQTMTEEAKSKGIMMHQLVQQQVKYCRIVDTYQKKINRRLEVNFAENSTSAVFWSKIAEQLIMQMTDVKRLPGIAPPGDMERRLQAALEAM